MTNLNARQYIRGQGGVVVISNVEDLRATDVILPRPSSLLQIQAAPIESDIDVYFVDSPASPKV